MNILQKFHLCLLKKEMVFEKHTALIENNLDSNRDAVTDYNLEKSVLYGEYLQQFKEHDYLENLA